MTNETFERNQLINLFKKQIKAGVLLKSDKYFRLWMEEGYEPAIKEGRKGLHELRVFHWSDSIIHQSVFKKKPKTAKEFISKCSELGAHTEQTEKYIKNNPLATPADVMEEFRVDKHVKTGVRAIGTYEECVEIRDALILWNQNYMMSQKDMEEDKKLNFIRVNRIANIKKLNGHEVQKQNTFFDSQSSF